MVNACQMPRRLRLFGEPENSADGFSVADAAVQRHLTRSRQGEKASCDSLIGFGLRFTRPQTAGQVDGHGFVEEAGADIEMQDSLPMAGGEAGLLEQLAASGCERRFAFVDAAGGQLPPHGLGGMAIL